MICRIWWMILNKPCILGKAKRKDFIIFGLICLSLLIKSIDAIYSGKGSDKLQREWNSVEQERSEYQLFVEEAMEMRESASEMMDELMDKNDKLSAWNIIETLDKAMENGRDANLLKRAIDEVREELKDLECM